MAGSTKYKNDWTAANRYRVSLVLPKDSKPRIRARANSKGMSLNEYIYNLIKDDMLPSE